MRALFQYIIFQMDPNNMLFRLEELTAEKVYEEYGISEEERMQSPQLYKMYIEDFIPTREDLEREIDDEKLKELCLRLPCRVLMHRWNPVQDFVNQFTRQGRIQRWTKEKTQKLLVKAVNRYRNECLYSDVEIRKQREREWCERKKENLMSLDVWEYDRQQELQNTQSEKEQHSICDSDNNNNNTTESATTANYNIPKEPTDEASIASTILNIEAVMAELHGSPALESATSDTVIMPPLSQTTNLNQADFTTNLLPQSQVQPISLPSTQNTEELAGREYVEMVQEIGVNEGPRLDDYINVNTESMQLDDSTTISQDVFDGECTPPYYEFNTHVSMTSTQSPSAK